MLAIDLPFRHHLQRDPISGLGACLWIEIVRRISPPFPFEPLLPRVRSVEIAFDREAHVAREFLRSLSDNQMMIGVVHDCLGHEGGCANTFDRRDSSRTLPRTMHAR